MPLQRVVVSGMHAITPLGNDWPTFSHALKNSVSAIEPIDDWGAIDGLSTRLGAPVHNFNIPPHWSRKKVRSMGRVAALATAATEEALKDATLLEEAILRSGRVGVAYGSCTGSTSAIQDLTDMISGNDSSKVNATTYIRLMGHTAPAKVFGVAYSTRQPPALQAVRVLATPSNQCGLASRPQWSPVALRSCARHKRQFLTHYMQPV